MGFKISILNQLDNLFLTVNEYVMWSGYLLGSQKSATPTICIAFLGAFMICIPIEKILTLGIWSKRQLDNQPGFCTHWHTGQAILCVRECRNLLFNKVTLIKGPENRLLVHTQLNDSISVAWCKILLLCRTQGYKRDFVRVYFPIIQLLFNPIEKYMLQCAIRHYTCKTTSDMTWFRVRTL